MPFMGLAIAWKYDRKTILLRPEPDARLSDNGQDRIVNPIEKGHYVYVTPFFYSGKAFDQQK
ncbi:hypothetical protein GCM10028806_00910 [Spirosoma terrae]